MRGPTAALALVCLAACSSAPEPAEPSAEKSQATEIEAAAETVEPELPPEPPPPPGTVVTLTVVSAEIEGRMPNGEDWDAREPSDLGRVPQPIARYVDQHPEIHSTAANTLGIPVDAPKLDELARKTPAADPMVILMAGDRAWRTTVKPRQFHPVWDFPATFLLGEHAGRTGVPKGSTVKLLVVDYDGPQAYDTIGSTMIETDALTGSKTGAKLHELGPFGSVKKLVLRVDERVPTDDPTPLERRLAVPGNAAWTDTGVAVVAGQRVSIEAADEVCSKGGSQSHCSGPEGQRKTSSYNVTGFEELGHAALIGAVGDVRFPVRRSVRFVAPSSGRLLLGINDEDVKDNRGSYAVRIVVEAVP